jgi:hypothetical protein
MAPGWGPRATPDVEGPCSYRCVACQQLSAIRALCRAIRATDMFRVERGKSCCLKASAILALAPT